MLMAYVHFLGLALCRAVRSLHIGWQLSYVWGGGREVRHKR